MTAFTASPIAGAPAAITLQIAIIPSPTFVRTAGIKPAIPVTITVSAATIAVAPAAPAVASAVNPIASEESPVPAASKPAPIVSTPTPINANAPDNARMVGTNGVRTAPATPIIVNAPAMEISPFAMASHDNAPKILSTGARTAKAPDATNNAADPPSVPFMKLRLIANSAKAPPMTVRPLPISSHCIPPNLLIQFAMISSAAPTITSPVPIPIMFFGIRLTAIATSASVPPMAVRPLPISSHCN